MHIIFLQNWPSEGVGRLRAVLAALGVDLTIVEAYQTTNSTNSLSTTNSQHPIISKYPTNSKYARNSPHYPNLAKVDGIIIGGTPISVNIVNDELLEEQQYLIQAISHRRPILGICGGSQLLAKLLGAEIRTNSVQELGITEISLTNEGKQHPLFAEFPPTFHAFQFHEETFSLPPEATHLATTPTCNQQAFSRLVWFGTQFHLEARTEEITQWTRDFLTTTPEDQVLKKQLIEQSQEFESEMNQLAYLLIKNFIAIITADKQANDD